RRPSFWPVRSQRIEHTSRETDTPPARRARRRPVAATLRPPNASKPSSSSTSSSRLVEPSGLALPRQEEKNANPERSIATHLTTVLSSRPPSFEARSLLDWPGRRPV